MELDPGRDHGGAAAAVLAVVRGAEVEQGAHRGRDEVWSGAEGLRRRGSEGGGGGGEGQVGHGRGWLVSARAPGGKVTNDFGHGKSFPFWESVTFPIDSRFFFGKTFSL